MQPLEIMVNIITARALHFQDKRAATSVTIKGRILLNQGKRRAAKPKQLKKYTFTGDMTDDSTKFNRNGTIFENGPDEQCFFSLENRINFIFAGHKCNQILDELERPDTLIQKDELELSISLSIQVNRTSAQDVLDAINDYLGDLITTKYRERDAYVLGTSSHVEPHYTETLKKSSSLANSSANVEQVNEGKVIANK